LILDLSNAALVIPSEGRGISNILAMNIETLHALYHQPLFDLISQSRAVHLEHWRGESVQRCSLLSIKTGGCSEDLRLLRTERPLYDRRRTRRFASAGTNPIGGATSAEHRGRHVFVWAQPGAVCRDGSDKFERVLETVREVSQLGMEVCVTLGEIGDKEATKLKAAGVTA
jgi:biotin synthase